ncbi:lytic transglycosylase domain-containing protein [Malikia granosa]|uniref:Lytic transglycosylase n=1 Tax=Malikia granosa TaxID=263067 RepID=A0A2S9K8X3_9BURK|nr:lytic transglycosylase domain-containing protein [Malikia granosa]PRD66864.1 lytic transglycosylase [Malikia granosa]
MSTALLGAPTAASAQSGPEQTLQDMREAFRKKDSRALSAALPRLQGHLLEPLGAYWELRVRLESASPDEIRAFMSRWAGSYYEDRLRNDWLLLLGRRGDWDNFRLEQAQYRMNDDREVQCYALLADPQGPRASAAETLRPLWLGQKEADEGCASAARALLQREALDVDTVWQRARLGMESGRLRVATQAVSMLDRQWAATVEEIYANPARYLEKLTALRQSTKELVTLALVRLAIKDHEEAAEQLGKLRWRTQLTDEERSWVWGVIGRQAALRLSPRALDYFNQAQERYLNDEMLAWKTRAALRSADWKQVQGAIAQMSEAQRRDPAWSYWQARALLALQGPDHEAQARALLQRIAGSTGFYEQLAQEALGQATAVASVPAPLSPAEKAAAQHNPGLQRALWAIANGLRSEGVREWNYQTNLHQRGGMNDRELLAAADLACQQQVWDRCINTSERTKSEIDYSQRFPTPHREQVVRRAREVGLDPAYVYGLIRQESRFITEARSGVGAAGLMQVMPATAQWTAKRIGLSDYKPHQIAERDTNILIGTAYLKLALDDFEGSMPMAAAAYNAGPGRPRVWRNGPVLEAPVWIENIPFTETRDYVKKVIANTTQYAALLSGQPQRIGSRLAAIGPRLGNLPPNADLP